MEYTYTTSRRAARMVNEEIDEHIKNLYKKYEEELTGKLWKQFEETCMLTVIAQMKGVLREFMDEWPSVKPVFLLGRNTYEAFKSEVEKLHDPREAIDHTKYFEGCDVIVNHVFPNKLEVIGEAPPGPWDEPPEFKSAEDIAKEGPKIFIDFHDGQGPQELHGGVDFGFPDEPPSTMSEGTGWYYDPGMMVRDSVDAFNYAMNYPKQAGKSSRIKKMLGLNKKK